MSDTRKDDGYKSVLTNDESLRIFLKAMADFDRAFCQAMVDGVDYTLRLEIHGNAGQLIHCRVNNDNFNRPRGSHMRERGDRRAKEHVS